MPVCSSCGQTSPEGFRYCGACGMLLDDTERAARAERRTLTVLFADLVGFTSLADRLDPEDVRLVLEPFHRQLRLTVAQLGGTVEKFIGDAVMAVFGAPRAHEDDPERAVRAALAIRDAMAALGEGAGASPLAVRIGVNSGEALLADVHPGEGERIVADFVNVAARLQAAAPVNGILVGEATYLATARAVEYRAFEPVIAKGKASPVLAWEAVAARSRIGADLPDRGRAPLVGRLGEVQLLCDAFARARDERTAQLVTLVGPPGIGKSRLVFELSSVIEDDPELVFWRRGACLPYGEEVTFSPLVEIVKAQAGILDTDTAAEAADKLRRELSECFAGADEATWVESHLALLAGLGPRDRYGDLGEHFAAWRRFFESLAEQRPLVLVFEDLHWADEGLLDFVEFLVEWANGVPLLAICTARPELLARRADWGAGKPNAVTVTVPALSDEETAELLDELLEQAALPAQPELKTTLVSRAGGNPLYAEEFVRMLAAHRPGTADGQLPVPESVQGIIAARLDVLPLEEKAVLQDAAVVGRTLWAGAVAHVGGSPRPAVDKHLRSLERRQFLRRERFSTLDGETEYSFRHLLVRDVAYGRIPRNLRLEKHRLAAEWIESLDRAGDHAETFAHHYSRALELARASGQDATALRARARVALRQAGDRAAGLKAFAVAAQFYARALELWPRDDPEWPTLRFRQGQSLYHAAETGSDILVEARDALLAVGDRETAAEAEVLLGLLAFRAGESTRTVAHYGRALRLLEGAPSSAAKAWALAALSRSLVVAARSEEALRVAHEALAMGEELGLEEVKAKALMTIGDARLELGDQDGMTEFRQGIAMAEELGSLEAATGYINLADTVTDLGDLRQAIELRGRAQRVAERLGDAKAVTWLRVERCGEAYWTGEWDEALAAADSFIAECEAGDHHYQEVYCRVLRGRVRLSRALVEEALDDVAKALDFARTVRDPQALYPALAFAARAWAAAGNRPQAEAVADELLALVQGDRQTPVAYLWLHDLAVALSDLGRGDDLLRATDEVRKPTPWLEAARALAAGDFGAAAGLYARIGALPDEAAARLRAARALAAAQRNAEADAELEQAAAFYHSVGAGNYTTTLSTVRGAGAAPGS